MIRFNPKVSRHTSYVSRLTSYVLRLTSYYTVPSSIALNCGIAQWVSRSMMRVFKPA